MAITNAQKIDMLALPNPIHSLMKQQAYISLLVLLICFPRQAQTNKIYGGSDAGQSEFPSFVFPQGQTFLCGATLIHEDIAITAAHCLDALTSFVHQNLLPFGNSNAVSIGGNQVDGSNAVDFRKAVIERQHPDYNSDGVVADLAVLKLDSPSSAPPAQFNTEPSDPSSGSSTVTVGYGITERWKFPSVLQKVTVDVVDSNSCTAQLAPYYDDSTMLCDGGSGVDSCSGDSGYAVDCAYRTPPPRTFIQLSGIVVV